MKKIKAKRLVFMVKVLKGVPEDNHKIVFSHQREATMGTLKAVQGVHKEVVNEETNYLLFD